MTKIGLDVAECGCPKYLCVDPDRPTCVTRTFMLNTRSIKLTRSPNRGQGTLWTAHARDGDRGVAVLDRGLRGASSAMTCLLGSSYNPH